MSCATATPSDTSKFLDKPKNINELPKKIALFFNVFVSPILTVIKVFKNPAFLALFEFISQSNHDAWHDSQAKKGNLKPRSKDYLSSDGCYYETNINTPYTSLNKVAKYENIQASFIDVAVFFAIQYALKRGIILPENINDYAGACIHLFWMRRIAMTLENKGDFIPYMNLSEDTKSYDYNRLKPIKEYFDAYPDEYELLAKVFNCLFEDVQL